MKNINIKLKKKIMMRVYFTFFLRKVFNPLAIKIYVLVSFTGFLISQVSLANVMANMPRVTEVSAFYTFSASAFLNTEFIVQVLSVGAIVAVFLLLKDFVKIYSIPTPITTYTF